MSSNEAFRSLTPQSRRADTSPGYMCDIAHTNGCTPLDVQLPVLPVEEVGLYLLLERIYHGTAAAKDFARVALLQPGLVDDHILNLSESGKDRLQLLRAKLAASNDDLASAAVWRET